MLVKCTGMRDTCTLNLSFLYALNWIMFINLQKYPLSLDVVPNILDIILLIIHSNQEYNKREGEFHTMVCVTTLTLLGW